MNPSQSPTSWEMGHSAKKMVPRFLDNLRLPEDCPQMSLKTRLSPPPLQGGGGCFQIFPKILRANVIGEESLCQKKVERDACIIHLRIIHRCPVRLTSSVYLGFMWQFIRSFSGVFPPEMGLSKNKACCYCHSSLTPMRPKKHITPTLFFSKNRPSKGVHRISQALVGPWKE